MKTIRQRIFETNSSSTHSMVIADGACASRMMPENDGKIHVHPGEFGWEVETYTDPYTKASYCATYARDMKDKNLRKMLEEVIVEFTGCLVVIEQGEGYIDHQSMEVCEAAFVSRNTLKQFIFCPLSVLRTDNDNH